MALFRRKQTETASTDRTEEAVDAASEAVAAGTPEEVAGEQAGEAPAKQGFFAKLRQGLGKTNRILRTDVRDLFKAEGRLIDEAFLDEMFAILIKTDIGVEPAERIVDQMRQNLRGRVVQLGEVTELWKSELKQLMEQAEAPIECVSEGPTVIMVCGVNGSGKTTSIAKLANLFVQQGKSVVLGAGDTFRAAAVEQLTTWAERLGVEIVTADSGTHPATVAYRAVEHAVAQGIDVCIVDTAGRLQTQKKLMDELTKIQNSMRKQLPAAPHEVLLVLDATTGQNGISQASNFSQAVHCTGIVLAKLDGTAKGGVVVAIRQQIGLPVKYIGVGEQAEDLALFVPDEFVDALFADV